MLCQFHKIDLQLVELKAQYGSSVQGSSLFELHQIATDLGFSMRGLEFELSKIDELSLPAIVHWSGNHFVILEALNGGTLTIIYPAFGRTEISVVHASRYITGFALEVISPPIDRMLKSDGHRESGPSIFQLIRLNRQIWPTMGLVGIGSILYQLLSLSAPYLVSLVIDKAVTPQARDTLSLIMWVFSGFFLAKIASLFINARLQANLHFSLNTALFGAMTQHVFSLPFVFFIKRSAADIHARLMALQAAHHFFKSGIFELPFSTLYAVGATVLLFYLEPTSALIALGFIIIGTLLEWPAQLFLEKHQNRLVRTGIEESKAMVSSLLRIDQIKINNSESREFAEVYECQRQRISAARDFEVAQRDVGSIIEAVRLVEKLVLVYFLADRCIDGKLSVGLAVAFLLFSDEIKDRLMTLIRVWSGYRTTKLQLAPLHEICVAAPEFEDGLASSIRKRADSAPPQLALQDIGFKYNKFGEDVLSEVSLCVEPGSKVVLFGESGSGKSTLLRILSTLIPPSSGKMTVNGVECDAPVRAKLRPSLGGMFSDDRLSDGTILTNITRDVPNWKEQDLNHVLKVTGLVDVVARLESGLDTLIIGDGRGLSSGQTQRVLLARALMRKPSILLLDEPTSHCDAQTSQAIAAHLASYDGTVIVCTHDAAFLDAFDTSYRVSFGRVETLVRAASHGLQHPSAALLPA